MALCLSGLSTNRSAGQTARCPGQKDGRTVGGNKLPCPRHPRRRNYMGDGRLGPHRWRCFVAVTSRINVSFANGLEGFKFQILENWLFDQIRKVDCLARWTTSAIGHSTSFQLFDCPDHLKTFLRIRVSKLEKAYHNFEDSCSEGISMTLRIRIISIIQISRSGSFRSHASLLPLRVFLCPNSSIFFLSLSVYHHYLFCLRSLGPAIINECSPRRCEQTMFLTCSRVGRVSDVIVAIFWTPRSGPNTSRLSGLLD